jgi:hypothetical protein
MTRDELENESKTSHGNESNMDASLRDDKSLRIGSSHGKDTEADERTGYARDITPDGQAVETGREARARGAGLSGAAKGHPSKNLDSRSKGFGIGGGYERPYRKAKPKRAENDAGLYGPLPHSGYYGAGLGARPFKKGQAGFADELSWYGSQYGESTSGFENLKKK